MLHRCMILALVTGAAATFAHADDWLHYAADARRSGVAPGAPDAINASLWSVSQYPPGSPIAFVGPSSPVVFGGRVYANARYFEGSLHVHNRLIAIDTATGGVLWQTLVDKSVLDSWSSPAVDEVNGLILLPTGAKLNAIDAETGALHWATPLNRSVVNASPLVMPDAIASRAFITDFDGFGQSASFYCINTSPYHAVANPYEPGEIVWTEPIGGASGATAAGEDGLVYVASISYDEQSCFEFGAITAFDVAAPPGSRRLWTTCAGTGFFGGVTLANGSLYAASYNLSGSGDNSLLVKLDATTGQVIWTIPCERTSSIPVVAGDRVFLSAGIIGFGSAPKVQCFRDDGPSAVKLWDTFVDTGGTLVLGGWTHQPMWSDGVLYVGKFPTGGGFFGAYTDLYALDVSRLPSDPLFVRDHRTGVGSSPALADGRLYSIGPAGLTALALRGDCTGDGALNGRDVACFVDRLLHGASIADGALLDFTSDGAVAVEDVPGFVAALLGEP